MCFTKVNFVQRSKTTNARFSLIRKSFRLVTSSNNCPHFSSSSSSPSTSSTPGPVLGRNDYPGFSHRGSVSSRPQSERSDSGVGMTTPRSASSQRGVLDEAAGGGNGGICVMAQARARLIFLYKLSLLSLFFVF